MSSKAKELSFSKEFVDLFTAEIGEAKDRLQAGLIAKDRIL